jgi:hypothetical protein
MFEFDDYSDAEVPPTDGTIVIDMLEGRPIISRCRYVSDTIYTWQQCSNWRELESNVLAYLNRGNISFIMGAFCLCPDNISTLATWSDNAISIFTLS